MLRRIIIGGAAVIVACTVVEGPCRIYNDEIYCSQGGKVSIFTPRPIAETVYAVNPIPPTVSVDPRILVPPKERN
jgi:hypothetical protein